MPVPPPPPSYLKACFLLAKISALATFGAFCTFQFAPLGILISCIALTAADCVRQDCRNNLFFPSQKLNKYLGVFFELTLRSWGSMVFVALVIAATHDYFCSDDEGGASISAEGYGLYR